MPAFFPQVTGTFRLEDPHPLRRFSMSAVGMGVATGLVVRLYRALTLSVGPNESLLYVGMAFILGQMFVLGMATLLLGNFTLRRWLHRAPVFAITAAATEALVSLGLIAGGLEPFGSTRAAFGDWTSLAVNILLWRVLAVLVYAAILAGMVQLVRYLLLKRTHREHTLDAVHHEASDK